VFVTVPKSDLSQAFSSQREEGSTRRLIAAWNGIDARLALHLACLRQGGKALFVDQRGSAPALRNSPTASGIKALLMRGVIAIVVACVDHPRQRIKITCKARG
jgi:hypothetical protein